MQGVFQALLWAGRGQNMICPWQLYEILRKSEAYFKIRCGRTNVRTRFARGGFKKVPVNFGGVSLFNSGQIQIKRKKKKDRATQAATVFTNYL